MCSNIKVGVVIVTCNREKELISNIEAIENQTYKVNKIYVVDNSAKKDLKDILHSRNSKIDIYYIHPEENIGGAGGFNIGLKEAMRDENDWFWVMDDDCLAHGQCLERLILGIDNDLYAYEPLVFDVSNRTEIVYDKKRKLNSGNHEVKVHVFNGLLFSRKIIELIGYPDLNMFIYWDDIDFCMRINRVGGKVFLNTNSIMYHPNRVDLIFNRIIKIYKYDFNKIHIYYSTRNRILVNRRYGGYKLQILEIFRRIIIYLLLLRYDLLIRYLKGLFHGFIIQKEINDNNSSIKIDKGAKYIKKI